MTAFPALTPTARSWTPGAKPVGVYTAMNGKEVRFKLGSHSVNQRLTLGYVNITETDGKLITDHFETVEGMFTSFTVPEEVFAGMDSYTYTLAEGNEWRYASPPSVVYERPGYQTVSVELIGVRAP